jgi:hypothetical protein
MRLAAPKRRQQQWLAETAQRTNTHTARPRTQRSGLALLLGQGGVCLEGVEDDAGEESFQAAECFAADLALAAFALEIGACRRVEAGLGDRDPVEGGVELSVTGAVEAVALCAS